MNEGAVTQGTVTQQMQDPVLVAIDGPAGSGKSSVSREAAERLGYGILDTGAAYRALAWAALQTETDLDDEAALLDLLRSWRYDITLRGAQRVTVVLPGQAEARDVTAAIRAPELSAQVSRVSKHLRVREGLNAMFRLIVADSGLPGVVIEGRDITTVVAPDAPVRLIMTASPEVRASRRAGERRRHRRARREGRTGGRLLHPGSGGRADRHE